MRLRRRMLPNNNAFSSFSAVGCNLFVKLSGRFIPSSGAAFSYTSQLIRKRQSCTCSTNMSGCPKLTFAFSYTSFPLYVNTNCKFELDVLCQKSLHVMWDELTYLNANQNFVLWMIGKSIDTTLNGIKFSSTNTCFAAIYAAKPFENCLPNLAHFQNQRVLPYISVTLLKPSTFYCFGCNYSLWLRTRQKTNVWLTPLPSADVDTGKTANYWWAYMYEQGIISLVTFKKARSHDVFLQDSESLFPIYYTSSMLLLPAGTSQFHLLTVQDNTFFQNSLSHTRGKAEVWHRLERKSFLSAPGSFRRKVKWMF